MLTALTLGLLFAAPPPRDVGVDRIEGLRTTWVTPSAWVPALRPARPLPKGPVAIVVHVDPDQVEDPASIGALLEKVDGVARVQADGHAYMVFLTGTWQDLSTVALPDGRTLADIADIQAASPPGGMPLPGGRAHRGSLPRGPAPDATEPAPGPSPRTTRPFPPPAPVDEATGWNLVIHNPYLGGRTKLSVQSLGMGEADPDSTVVLHDVQPGLYEVTFETPTGATRTRTLGTTQATEPSPEESSPPSPQ